MRIFRDSVTPGAIPLDGIDGVFGYCNGRFRWADTDYERFTRAGKQTARIDVNGTAWEAAAIVDCEQGDIGPAQAPDWIRKRHAFRQDAVVYCDRSTLPGLLAATSRITEPWRLWLADWTGHPHIPVLSLPHNVKLLGIQFVSHPDYDESVIIDDTWHPARRAA
jgi:hypothetical protein